MILCYLKPFKYNLKSICLLNHKELNAVRLRLKSIDNMRIKHVNRWSDMTSPRKCLFQTLNASYV
jgi:hypothetical protein